MRVEPGRCRWCRCTYTRPCPEGCGWADRAQTLCTACVEIDKAWNQQMRRVATPREQRTLTAMRPAFFQGFLVGAGDERQSFMPKPYRDAKRRTWFTNGKTAGERWLARVTGRRNTRRWHT